MSLCDANNRIEYCADQEAHDKTSNVGYNKSNVKSYVGEIGDIYKPKLSISANFRISGVAAMRQAKRRTRYESDGNTNDKLDAHKNKLGRWIKRMRIIQIYQRTLLTG